MGRKRKTVNKKDMVRAVYNDLSKKSVDGGVTPGMLVKASKAKNAPLHSYFEWENDKAAQGYRLWQARMLLRDMTIEIEDVRTREFQNIIIEVDDAKTRKYYHLDQILSDDDLKRRVLAQVTRQLRFMIKRYNDHKEIYKLVDTSYLSELESELNRQPVSP